MELAIRERPDIGLLDFHLPDTTGDELTRALLSDPLTQNVLVVVLTSQMEVKEVALAAGAIDVIYKGEQQGAFVQRVASIREYRRQIGRQIRRHIRSAEEAKRLHGWVESILQSMGEAVMVLDKRGVVIHANSAAGRLLEAEVEVVTDVPQALEVLVEIPRNPTIQMVVNLLQNSIDAIVQRQSRAQPGWGGEIQITLQVAGGKTVLLIEDNGCGIEAGQRPQLFTPGYSTKLDGSGFGLHSIGGFLQGVGGTLELLSEGRDRGTVAKIII